MNEDATQNENAGSSEPPRIPAPEQRAVAVMAHGSGAMAAPRALPERLTVDQLVEGMALVREVQNRVMVKDVDYGVIPGTGKKPTLLKPGAEKLLMIFRISQELVVEDLSERPSAHLPLGIIRYRIRAIGRNMATGQIIGEGLGEGSSEEAKWKWRKASGGEYDRTESDQRRSMTYNSKFKSGETYTVEQVRQNPYDMANTILKMSKKRASVDLALTVTAASGLFQQDVEDIPNEMRGNSAPPPAAPRGRQSAPPRNQQQQAPPQDYGGEGPEEMVLNPNPIETTQAISDGTWQEVGKLWHTRGVISRPQVNRLFAIAGNNGWGAEQVKEVIKHHFGVSVDAIPKRPVYDRLVDIFEAFEGPGVSGD